MHFGIYQFPIHQGIKPLKQKKKTMSLPDTYNNTHEEITNVGVFVDHRGEYVPSIVNTAFLTRGFQSFEVGSAAVIDGRWVGGDKHGNLCFGYLSTLTSCKTPNNTPRASAASSSSDDSF